MPTQQDLTNRIKVLEDTMVRFLKVMATPAKCKSEKCRAPVYWVTTKAGKPALINVDGVSHWATCPDSERFRGTRRKKS